LLSFWVVVVGLDWLFGFSRVAIYFGLSFSVSFLLVVTASIVAGLGVAQVLDFRPCLGISTTTTN
jgi:hypothetical protein